MRDKQNVVIISQKGRNAGRGIIAHRQCVAPDQRDLVFDLLKRVILCRTVAEERRSPEADKTSGDQYKVKLSP